MVHSKKSLFQHKFQKKLYYFNRNSQFKSVILKMIQLDTGVGVVRKNPTLIPSVARNPTPTPPQTSDSLRLQLRNPISNST